MEAEIFERAIFTLPKTSSVQPTIFGRAALTL